MEFSQEEIDFFNQNCQTFDELDDFMKRLTQEKQICQKEISEFFLKTGPSISANDLVIQSEGYNACLKEIFENSVEVKKFQTAIFNTQELIDASTIAQNAEETYNHISELTSSIPADALYYLQEIIENHVSLDKIDPIDFYENICAIYEYQNKNPLSNSPQIQKCKNSLHQLNHMIKKIKFDVNNPFEGIRLFGLYVSHKNTPEKVQKMFYRKFIKCLNQSPPKIEDHFQNFGKFSDFNHQIKQYILNFEENHSYREIIHYFKVRIPETFPRNLILRKLDKQLRNSLKVEIFKYYLEKHPQSFQDYLIQFEGEITIQKIDKANESYKNWKIQQEINKINPNQPKFEDVRDSIKRFLNIPNLNLNQYSKLLNKKIYEIYKANFNNKEYKNCWVLYFECQDYYKKRNYQIFHLLDTELQDLKEKTNQLGQNDMNKYFKLLKQYIIEQDDSKRQEFDCLMDDQDKKWNLLDSCNTETYYYSPKNVREAITINEPFYYYIDGVIVKFIEKWVELVNERSLVKRLAEDLIKFIPTKKKDITDNSFPIEALKDFRVKMYSLLRKDVDKNKQFECTENDKGIGKKCYEKLEFIYTIYDSFAKNGGARFLQISPKLIQNFRDIKEFPNQDAFEKVFQNLVNTSPNQ
ncbi:hypothetical protein TRFO_37695 [Tritrichomonas foetus]|uniref:Uncharacterized protein n=1 Tax=Tritrichomonas foetus TaxID=1144522 RepID=A0A1J4JES2_9EUKA|nr:hypothetical protein TRFO_37695 [Tritrichomonas foetus]|eukprot:OHS96139.1 hypothetical protein TRFO_37695 [Tritrichomonas foetus]